MPHEIKISVSDDWVRVDTSCVTLTEEQVIMALKRALTFREARYSIMLFHKITTDLVREDQIRKIAGNSNLPGETYGRGL